MLNAIKNIKNNSFIEFYSRNQGNFFCLIGKNQPGRVFALARFIPLIYIVINHICNGYNINRPVGGPIK